MIEVISVILFMIGLTYTLFSIYSLTRQRSGMSGLFSLLCLAVAIYIIGYGFEVHSHDTEQMMFFIRMEYFGGPFITAFWLLFAYKFYFHKNPGFSLSLALMIIPFITAFLGVTNDYHHLIYTNVSAIQVQGHMIAILEKGPVYYAYVFYSYLAFLVGFIAFLFAWRNSLYMMKEQSFLMLLGSVFPLAANLIYLADLSPYGMDLEPFGLGISAVFLFIAIRKFDFLERGEIVRGTAFSETSEGIFFLDEKKRLIDYNHAAMKVFPWLDKKNIGRELSCFEGAGEIDRQKHNHFELRVDGEDATKYYEFRVSEVRKKNRLLGKVFYFRDVTKLKELLQVMDDLASYDVLSQVYTRRRVMEEAEREAQRAVRQKGRLSVMMIDIDFFKQINDQYGHPAGDEVIRQVAGVIRETIRRTDMAGRYGGEEFIVILSGPDLKDSVTVAELIRKKVEDLQVEFDNKIIRTTVSIGVAPASAEEGDIDIKKIIKTADFYLYRAKSHGRNTVRSGLNPADGQ